MATYASFDLATSSASKSLIKASNSLNSFLMYKIKIQTVYGPPAWIRTKDPEIRSFVRYPTAPLAGKNN